MRYLDGGFNVVVRAEKLHAEYLKHGSLELALDAVAIGGLNGWRYKTTVGEVVQVPDEYLGWVPQRPELKAGDKVYFHFNALGEDSLLPDSDLYLVPLDMVFAYVMDGELHAMSGKALCLAEADGENLEGVGRVKMSGGIITETNVKHNMKMARLALLGSPLLGMEEVDAKAGDLVFYAKDADFENEIEGKKYLVMDQDLILAKWDKDKTLFTT